MRASEVIEDKWGFDALCDLEDNGFSFKNKTIYVNEKKITPRDVAYYYANDARDIISGCRRIGEIVGDWRPIDNLAETCLQIYKLVNMREMKRAVAEWKDVMEPRGW